MLNRRTNEARIIKYIKENYKVLTRGEMLKELVENTNFSYKKAVRVYDDIQAEMESNKYKNKDRETFKFDTSKLWRKNE